MDCDGDLRPYRARPELAVLDMLSRFYERYSGVILWAVTLSFPFLVYEARTLRCNNDIETWLPRESAVREGRSCVLFIYVDFR